MGSRKVVFYCWAVSRVISFAHYYFPIDWLFHSFAFVPLFFGEKSSMYTLDIIKLQHPTLNPYTTFA